ncbi:MAG TPA: glycerophosphodiester phosphodiesterase [Candidatus Angelobacter sp.]
MLGHRGARQDARENTPAAFDLALEHGADGFEFDVRLTRNRQLVICHDPKFKRLPVRRATLKQLQASCTAPAEFPPTLQEALDRYADCAFLNLEVKVRGIERLVYRIIRSFPPQRGYFISSFHPSVVREFHRLDSSLVLGTLSQTRWQLRRWETLPAGYVVPQYRLLSRRLVEEIHAAKKLVVTWTVNEPSQMARAAALGVDGIISDDTKLLVETLKSGECAPLARRRC